MRDINLIVIHCAATPPGADIGAAEIDAMHKARGWRKIGYHHVIRRNGAIEAGRPHEEIGAHTQGHNAHSIGVCLVGGVDATGHAQNNFTAEQFAALTQLLRGLRATYPGAQILGHRDLSPDQDGDGVIEKWEWVKDCPSFDVRAWLQGSAA